MEAEQEPHEPQNNQRARETSYKKRNPTVMRKANELSQLCNISVCVISYGPDGNVNTWPESREDVVEILNDYKNHSGIHKKWPFGIRENNNNKEGEGEEDVDEESEEEHEERNKVEEFGNELKKWKNWLREENEEASLKRGFNMLKSNLCAMKNRLKLLQNRKRKRSNNDNSNSNTTDTPNNNSNSFEVGSGSSCTRTTRARTVHDFDLNEEVCVDNSGDNDEHQNVGSMDVSTPLEVEPISMWPMITP
ncbi:hypothetical protein SO802_021985 [Lithocarpus litseifolius]|uniref:MADS-box domain-containing protein n=1 Tax=Lithocarpus litseifolius TaxID=425828 RepID=A0AAW2CGB8_9ROSI